MAKVLPKLEGKKVDEVEAKSTSESSKITIVTNDNMRMELELNDSLNGQSDVEDARGVPKIDMEFDDEDIPYHF
ncbi:hypothetical protein QJS10_CPB04g00697 [Acorus calamus]|uniref:Uncharacterized protein n=1 Tax=Acorus calamus TaxID=4465 RepID=A0AAV9F1T8_ACOCL|nr:hypothetical protein QJS10_CPB04g00697 [Acorus calamus]